MKTLIVFFFFLSLNASGSEICRFMETHDFVESMEEKGIAPFKVSRNHKRFSFREKQMIHLTMTQEDWAQGLSQEEALLAFGDYFEGELGENAGEIVYYEVKGKNIIIVRYWPGENEYGAIFEVKKSSFKLIASVQDSFISCK